MANKLKGILIDPVDKSIKLVEVDNDCRAIAKLLNCEWVEQVQAGGGAVIVIDEEGKLVRPNPNGYFRCNPNGQVLAGKGLVLHQSGPDWVDARVSIEAVRGSVSFVDHDGVSDAEIEPRHSVYAMNDDMSRGELKHSYVMPVKRLDS